MPRDKSANHIKLMAAARAEFLEFGFEKASMRSIGERCGMTSSREPQWRDSWTDMMREVVYPHMEDYILLVAKSGGTKYENFLHDLTETGQKQFLSYLPVLRKLGYPVWDIDPEALHLLLSAYSTALFEPVIHSYPPEDAIRCLDTIEAFFLPGWKKLMGF